MNYEFRKIEAKWQDAWEKAGIFEVKEKKEKRKYFIMEMYPYPSASFLHMGHVRNYTIGDVYARFKRMNGFNVLYPMGYDSFGLPAETAAKKEGIHPKKYTEEAIKKIIEYQKALGNSYDWSRVIASHDSNYYKWNQFFFLKLFEKGLAYRKKAPVNWCENCESVLADEEAEGGKCWRCDSEVSRKELEQWFFKITNYAEKLLQGLNKIDWPERIKIMQRNWIGKSFGTEIDLEVASDDKISNCVIVHGCPSNVEKAMDPKTRTYDKHWIPWTKKELEKKEIKVLTPLMPEPWKPIYENWKKEFDKLEVNEDSVLIGHSCGCAFLVRWLGDTKKKIKKLILVAPWKIAKKGDKVKENFYNYPINYSVKIPVGEVTIFSSNDEEEDGKKSAKIFHDALGGEFIELKSKGHYTMDDMGTKEFPELLDKITPNKKWSIFTTRPDTIYGATFMVISSQHPKLLELADNKHKKQVEEFIKKCQKARTTEEIENLEKEGVFIGKYALNPLTKEKVPIYAGNFVLADYGSGMVMAVPAHDQRDFEFAKKYGLPIKIVIQPKNQKSNPEKMSRAYVDEGVMINSDKFNGMQSSKAIEEISDFIEKRKFGKRTVHYKIRDWLISRQRYWGTPIPIIYCEKCGIVPVPYKDLPILLPERVDFKAKTNPLLSNKDFMNVKCPKCNRIARRETDTMGGFVDSSWYFLRYCDNKNKIKPFDEKKVAYWMPIDQYIGGAEHAVMHLIYARFFVKALKDLGFVKFDEPFMKLFNQGIVYKDGAKMSKSAGNVVFQTEISEKYGIDTARLFLMFVSSPDKQMEWSDEGVEGASRIINKLANLIDKINNKNDARSENKINITIKKVTESIGNFQFPKAIIAIIEALDYFSAGISRKNYEVLLKLISPFCPHIAEELWHQLGNRTFISLEKWPKADESKIDPRLEEQEKQVTQTIEDIKNIFRLVKEKQGKEAGKIYLYVLPKELAFYKENKTNIEKSLNIPVEILSVSDKQKYDPQNKAGKAKLGKPAIYIE